ncbi:hypothetical protein Nepgr_004439 [Nepenthes gracilis]|uniref:Pectinesterase n=1 Tax=Nepenthes gracilis TaxID=150966 RepID=A0AAD3S1C6_NEPGR|nr:hypothetical protein Nepgr_004439 [Nepenthes gracilis]
MAFDSLVSVIAISLAFLPFFFLHSVADTTNATAPVSASTVCNSTLYPGFCKKVLQADNQTANVYEYGRFSVKKSLSAANKFLHLVNKYLSKRRKLTAAAVRALEDCQLLAQLNIDFLSTSFQTVNTTSKVLSSSQAEDIQTLLSGILTNQQTCLDGLKSVESAWTVKNGLAIPLANDTKLYSVSLAIVTKGWVPKNKKGSSPKSRHGRKLSGIRNGQLQLKMSEKTRRIFETVSRRNLIDDSSDSGDNGVMVSGIVTVSQDGSGDYTLINDAIAAAPNNSNGTDGYFLIYVAAGVYPEYVSIAKNKKYLLMIGDGINQTIITGNRSYVDGWTTFSSATFAVVGTGFVAVNITIRNTAGAIKHQAVALRNGADWSTFYFCSFEGYQDTLYAYSLRQFYRECDIYGTIDFIFGNAAVIFQNCNLYPRLPLQYQFNAITAQGRTDPGQTTGTSILNCTIKAADDLASSNGTTQTYLGRPWKQYSRTVYIESYMGSLINPAGWTEWNGTFALDTLYYGEFNNTGPGSNTTGRVTWPGYHIMNATDAANYTVSNFLLGDDWLPQTGVQYFDNLV